MEVSPNYHRSSFCGGGNCVEVAPLESGWIALRDSKERGRSDHLFTRDEWADFLRGIHAGEFDFGMKIDRVPPWTGSRRTPRRRSR